MKVVHVCLSNFYIDNRSYQENELIRQHVSDGHDVLVIASTENQNDEGRITYVEPGEYIGREGARVVRLPYHPLLPQGLGKKLRVHRGVDELLSSFAPEAVLFHGLCGWELLTVAQFALANPDVRLYADTHADWNNSARGFVSREILHRLYYGSILRRALPAIRKVLCISIDAMEFAHDVYGVPREALEFFPLAGHPVPDDVYHSTRRGVRQRYGIEEDQILFVQSGKLTRRKRLLTSLRAFAHVPDPRFRLLIAGALFDDIAVEARRLIEADSRVTFIGWQDASDLDEILCGADVYLQPGTQSVTMQHSLCARCAVIIDDVPSHEVYHRGNGWLLAESADLTEVLASISRDPEVLASMQSASYELAQEMLDYSVHADRILR